MKPSTLFCSLVTLLFAGSSAMAAEAVFDNNLTVNQWVSPSETGVLTGRVVVLSADGGARAVPQARVALLGENGRLLRGETNSSGTFRISGVTPGMYSVATQGKDAMACSAVHVLEAGLGADGGFPSTLEIAAAQVDYEMVRAALLRYVPPAGAMPPAPYENIDTGSLASRVVGDSSYVVSQANGGMKGRILTPGAVGAKLYAADRVNVFVIRDGVEVARTVTNETGQFTIESLAPGQYALLAAGEGGMGLTAFTLVGAAEAVSGFTSNSNEGGQHLVTRMLQQGNSEFVMQLAPSPQVVDAVVSDRLIDEQIIGEEVVMDGFGTPIAGGGFAPGGFAPGGGFAGGGGFGGGGGGLGGGGLGGLAALGAIGAVVAVAASDDDDEDRIPVVRPVSPVNPDSNDN